MQYIYRFHDTNQTNSIIMTNGLWNSNKEQAKEIIKRFTKRKTTATTNIVFFSDNINNNNGERIARQIKKLKLGKIIETPPIHNENYQDPDHKIQTWMWIINRKKILEWHKKQ